jgi:hypothetical protein
MKIELSGHLTGSSAQPEETQREREREREREQNVSGACWDTLLGKNREVHSLIWVGFQRGRSWFVQHGERSAEGSELLSRSKTS